MLKRAMMTGCLAVLATCVAGAASAAPLSPRQIYKKFGKSVVLVFATDGSAQGSAGTGSIIKSDGQIITNAHVVAKNGRPFKRIFVYMKPDKLKGSMKADLKHRFEVSVVDIDDKLDLALLRMLDPPESLQHIDFVDPDKVEIGEPVVAIGHPETGGLWTLTTGSISSVVADFQGIKGKDVFQTEASVNRGNSGGPLLNAYGQMVGINTSISRKAADGLAITDINFSLKSSVAVEWLKRRQLATLAYASPGDAGDTAIAMAETKKPDPAVVPAVPEDAKTVKSTDGKVEITVLEPEKKEEVAQDPEWHAATTENVHRGMSGRVAAKARKKKLRVKPKHLTKHRPYKLDPFVAARVREIRALEKMMDDMSGEIRKKSGGKKKKSNGMGLW